MTPNLIASDQVALQADFILDSGFATASSTSTLTDSTQTWQTNEHVNRILKIVGGTGSGQEKQVVSNTASVITVAGTWQVNPDTTSQYVILDTDPETLNITISSSETSTTTYNSPDQVNTKARGVMVVVDCTSFTGTNFTVSIQAKDPLSGKYITIAADTAQTGVATRTLLVYPGAGAAANGVNAVGPFPLPNTWRVVITKTAVTVFTATVSALYVL